MFEDLRAICQTLERCLVRREHPHLRHWYAVLGQTLPVFQNEVHEYATVGGGSHNTAGAVHATVGGDSYNTADVEYSVVGGGNNNTASATRATIGGGYSNVAIHLDATVSGGGGNTASGQHATVGGGSQNAASGYDATVGGGSYNATSGPRATISGGRQNTVSGFGATIGGGAGNTASANYATVGGGLTNDATGSYDAVGGGYGNTAGGAFSAVPGGFGNKAAGGYSFASGHQAVVDAAHDGVFLFADSIDFVFQSAVADEFAVRATGGVRLVTAIDDSGDPVAGVNLLPGSGSWSSLSNWDAKANIVPVNADKILASLVELPISTWNYTSQDPSIRHIGPMAQDFYAAFDVGDDDRHISTMDADGVALAAIQGLYVLVKEQGAQIASQQQQITALEARLAALERANEMGGSLVRPTYSGVSSSWLLLGGLCLLVVWGSARWRS